MAHDKNKLPQDGLTTDTRPRMSRDDAMTFPKTASGVSSAAKPKLKNAPPNTVKDNWREIVETVVFVVVLVLLLKTFAAEAFVIPTGSMAETLYGYQKLVTCPQCDFEFPVNCSTEVEENSRVTSCVCPNCRYSIFFAYVDSGKVDKVQNDRLLLTVDPKREPLDIGVDSQTTITLDGHELQLLDEIRQANEVRAIYQIRDSRLQASWVDAITKGSFPDREKLLKDAGLVRDRGWSSGDRVLVAKHLSDTHLLDLERFDVVVFKFPEEPEHNYEARNYIKRLIGLPGETIGIYHGDLYVATGIDYPAEPLPDEADLPVRRQMHKNFPAAVKLLEEPPPEGVEPRFRILRKSPAKVLATRRIVFDNNHQPRDLLEKNFPPRWAAEKDGPGLTPEDYRKKRERAAGEGAWTSRDGKGFQHAARAGSEIDWLRYRHLLRTSNAFTGEPQPERITDFIGYNQQQEHNWVGDLILEFKIEVKQNDGDLIVELAKGVDRFQARWQLSTGLCTLVRHGKEGKDQELAKKQTSLNKPGTYHVRVANVDQRLTIWVDSQLPFEDGVAYAAPSDRAEEDKNPNNFEPASIGVQGAEVEVQDLVLWRDIYYTNADGIKTLYVQPGHYLCLGDNSPQSSDSRSWAPQRSSPGDPKGGLVPEELMLGRALLVYWPLRRAGTIK